MTGSHLQPVSGGDAPLQPYVEPVPQWDEGGVEAPNKGAQQLQRFAAAIWRFKWLVVLLAGFTLMQSARYAWQMAELGRASDMGSIPMWIPHGVVAVGFALILASVLRK